MKILILLSIIIKFKHSFPNTGLFREKLLFFLFHFARIGKIIYRLLTIKQPPNYFPQDYIMLLFCVLQPLQDLKVLLFMIFRSGNWSLLHYKQMTD